MKKVLIAIGAIVVAVALAVIIIVCVNNDKNDDTGANSEESLTEWYETDEIVFPEIPW